MQIGRHYWSAMLEWLTLSYKPLMTQLKQMEVCLSASLGAGRKLQLDSRAEDSSTKISDVF